MAGQIWATNSLGGYFYSLNLSDKLRHAVQPMVKFRQFCDAKDASMQGKKKGDVYTWDVVGNVTVAGTTLVETNTMPETQCVITQGTLTITEAGNSIPYSGKLEDLSQFAVRETFMKALKNDAAKAFDKMAHAAFNNTPLRVVPAASGTSTTSLTLTTNGTCTGTNTIAFRANHAKLVSELMKERNIPAYVADDYYALAWPSTYHMLRDDLESVHQYTPEGLRMIMNGEIGRYRNIRFVEQTNIGKGVANAGTAWSTGLSDWIYFFGEDTAAEAIAVPEEVRAKIPTDFGRSKGIAWYYLGGFGLVHTAASEARVVKWDSAA